MTKHKKRIPKQGEDLQTMFPTIAAEWDYELNDEGPETYFSHSNQTVNWICDKGHPWPARINNRTSSNTGCPYCKNKMVIPGVNDLRTLFPYIADEWDCKKNERDPSEYLPSSNYYANWVCSRGHRWKSKIYHRTEGRGCPHCNGTKPIQGENDFETLFPRIAEEWHPSKNGRTPDEFAIRSHFEAIWICPLKHEYKSPIYRRTRGSGCPVCDGKTVIPGINDLETRAPHLAKEWDFLKNGELRPSMVALHSNRKVHWKCPECKHEWQTSPNNRINQGTKCPACSHHAVEPQINSLKAVNPILAREWDKDNNAPLSASDVAANDNRDYSWICARGHLWEASPANRNRGTGCPYCNGKRPIVGENDLSTVCPKVAAQWHSEKNGDALPEHYLPNSHEMMWWGCESGHEWQMKIYEMANGGTCPYCNHRKAITGVNDVATKYPELLNYWDWDNNDRKPEETLADMKGELRWICPRGHRFKATITRMRQDSQCKECLNKKKTIRRTV